MHLTFKTNKLEKILNDARAIQKTFGTMAKRVAQRMDQFRAANNLAELISYQAANCHSLSGDYH